MPTSGYKPFDKLNVEFYLAPRVIDEMKALNPKLTLIGCKMTSGASREDLIEAAYQTLLHARCNVVVANDLRSGLQDKHLVYPDHSVVTHSGAFEQFYQDLDLILSDVHYSTWLEFDSNPVVPPGGFFDHLVEENRSEFILRDQQSDRVFGAILIRDVDSYVVSPREKGRMFSSKDATRVLSIKNRVVHVRGSNKATLNAPLLCRVADKYGSKAVVHIHKMIPDVPEVPYAPPGTARDNEREIPGPSFNIKGHGCIISL